MIIARYSKPEDFAACVPEDFINLAELDGRHFAWELDGEVFCVAGVVQVTPTRAVAYLNWPKKDHHVTVMKDIIRWHRKAGSLYNRLECTVDTRDELAVEFAIVVGYEIEGTMKRFGPEGEDHYIMRYEKPWQQ